MSPKLKIAVIGQSAFGAEVFNLLLKDGHEVVAVFTPPAVNGRHDILATTAKAVNVPQFEFKSWRVKGQIIPEIFEQYKTVGAELNVLAFCSQFIPMEVINYPKHKSICYHPSILPRGRGASAINWTLIKGDKRGGFTIFWPDDGLDTGEILLQESCAVLPNDTLNTLYKRFLFPMGVLAMGRACKMIAEGRAPKIKQPEDGATYDPMMKKDNAGLDLSLYGEMMHNFVRGCDKVPGAWVMIGDKKVSLFASEFWRMPYVPQKSSDKTVTITDCKGVTVEAIVHRFGLYIPSASGEGAINVTNLKIEGPSGRALAAGDWFAPEPTPEAPLTLDNDVEKAVATALRASFGAIVNAAPDALKDAGDFFKMGAASMDVVRLVEEVNQACASAGTLDTARLSSEDVYAGSTLGALTRCVVRRVRGISDARPLEFDAHELRANGMTIACPRQIFVDNEFRWSVEGDDRRFDTVNPSDESVICQVASGTAADVEYAVAAAKRAFDDGPWRQQLSTRDRGKLLARLADLMEEHKTELATIEAVDSGAVYTLALKTHVGMSIDTFRYYAGWCDKVAGETLPIAEARPGARFLTYTRREPVGVCAAVIPWNYPLMMLAWKLGACLAAGNTVVLKPAQVTPLTALKWAELVVRAGFPPGVVNIVPGSGRVVGQALADHPDVRKIGFTGSTGVGKRLMSSAALSNAKKVSLELGGKSALIVAADQAAHLARAVRVAMGAVFFNKGENCIAAGRVFVHHDLHDDFVEAVRREVGRMRIGDPLDRATDHGPQNHLAHLDKLLAYCDRAVKEGATLVCGGGRVPGVKGLFMQPTVLTDVTDDNFAAIEESFGPIMVISKFHSLEEAIERANACEFGLAGGILTESLGEALNAAEKLDAGTVFVNTYNKTDVAVPFGGFKQSGFGKDLGPDALKEWSKQKVVTIQY